MKGFKKVNAKQTSALRIGNAGGCLNRCACLISYDVNSDVLTHETYRKLLMRKLLEDIREIIRNYKSRKDRQYNDQKKKNKRKNSDLQNIIQKTKDRSTRTPLNTEDELRSSKM